MLVSSRNWIRISSSKFPYWCLQVHCKSSSSMRIKMKIFLPNRSTVKFLFSKKRISSSSSRSFSFEIVKQTLPSSTRVISCDKITLKFSLESNTVVFNWRSLSGIFFEVMLFGVISPYMNYNIFWFPLWKKINVAKHSFDRCASATSYTLTWRCLLDNSSSLITDTVESPMIATVSSDHWWICSSLFD